MLVIAAAAERSGLLTWIAQHAARFAHRPSALLLATFGAGVLITITLNLDTTAVLFTPLAIAIGKAAGQRTAPFALSAVLAANFGSVLLPSSNLTNLVIWRETGVSFAEFARTMAPIAGVAIVVTAAALHLATRRSLVPTMKSVEDVAVHDRRLALASGVTVVGLMVALLLGAPVVPASLIGAAVVVAARPVTLRSAPVSPPLLGSLLALFGAAAVLGASPTVQRLLGHLDTAPRAAIAGTLGSAVTTNLATAAVLAPAAVSRTLTAGPRHRRRPGRRSHAHRVAGNDPLARRRPARGRARADAQLPGHRRAAERPPGRRRDGDGVTGHTSVHARGTMPRPSVNTPAISRGSPTVSGLAGVVQRQNISFPS